MSLRLGNALNLQRPMVFLDIEATGVEPATDRIIDLALVTLSPQGCNGVVWRLNPERPIPPAATRVHGITDAEVAGKPTFAHVAEKIRPLVRGCDFGGFNLKYDLALLSEEFARARVPWDLHGARVVDVCGIFRRMEPRTLTAAVLKYCGRLHEGAHGALADTLATMDVLLGQIAQYQGLADRDLGALAEFSTQQEFDGQTAQPVDLAGKLVRTADGIVRYAFGKPKGLPVTDDPGFGHWMLGKDFTEDTKLHVRKLLGWYVEPGE